WALLATAAVSGAFYYGQNHAGVVGGPISVEKMLWLHYAITTWFVVPAFLVAHRAVHPSLRRVLGAFLASMLARGAIELWLIYVAFAWSPLYGIAHDLSCIALIAALRRAAPADLDPFNRGVRRFLANIQLALVAEIAFAELFHATGAHRDAVYFAAATPEFAHINALTRVVDAAFYADLGVFLWRHRRPLLGRPAPLREAWTA
ncbi:MAG TPA: hypothetical protein VNN07_04970, partial [Candidatus Tectomicrobia bacterium]|nr:hypothetical protein [Candidatus Tectomicrobia bacterium]